MEKVLPPIPAKRYFTIGEVGDLCGVKPHVLRYWEQEFTQLRPMKRRGNRRYYQHHEVLMIRRIRDLLYDQGFTISGARNKMQEILLGDRDKESQEDAASGSAELIQMTDSYLTDVKDMQSDKTDDLVSSHLLLLRRELFEIRDILAVGM